MRRKLSGLSGTYRSLQPANERLLEEYQNYVALLPGVLQHPGWEILYWHRGKRGRKWIAFRGI